MGNIYIADYEILKDVKEASEERYLTAPICLLYKNESDQIVPIAIQVSVSYRNSIKLTHKRTKNKSPVTLYFDGPFWTFCWQNVTLHLHVN